MLGGVRLRIYVDVVAFINFLIDFLLLLGTNRLAGFPPGYGRCAMAAALGGVYGGACLIPGLSFLGSFLWRTVFLSLMAVIAFGWNSSAWMRGAVFLLLSMALGGIAVGMRSSSFWVLLVSLLLMWVLCNVSFRGNIAQREYIPVTLWWADKEMKIIALRDTGNTLHDPLTGERVLVAGADIGMKLLGLSEHQLAHPVETLASGAVCGLRLIPYHAVGQPAGMLLAVRFQKARIGKKEAQPLVAFAPDRIARGEVYQMLTGGIV